MMRGFAQNIDGLHHRRNVLFTQRCIVHLQFFRWPMPSEYCIISYSTFDGVHHRDIVYFQLVTWRSAKNLFVAGYCEMKNYNAPLSDAINWDGDFSFFMLHKTLADPTSMLVVQSRC